MAKSIGICAHSYEGGALCFLAACRAGAEAMGPHMHPTVLVSAIPMGLSMSAWEANNYHGVAKHLRDGVDQLAKSGAVFFICPDNTAHVVLEPIITDLPLPGLHIAEVVSHEIVLNQWSRVGLLGTKWTMNGTVYPQILKQKGLSVLTPNETTKAAINEAIFEELCQGIFKEETINLFLESIKDLKEQGAECVILGCTEIPLIINTDNSSLPILDSTRLLSKYAVQMAIADREIPPKGWIDIMP